MKTVISIMIAFVWLYLPVAVQGSEDSKGVCNFGKEAWLWGAINFGGESNPVSNYCDKKDTEMVRELAENAVEEVNKFYHGAQFRLLELEGWEGRRLKQQRRRDALISCSINCEKWMLRLGSGNCCRRRLGEPQDEEQEMPLQQRQRHLTKKACPAAVNKFEEFFLTELSLASGKKALSDDCYGRIMDQKKSNNGNWDFKAVTDDGQ